MLASCTPVSTAAHTTPNITILEGIFKAGDNFEIKIILK